MATFEQILREEFLINTQNYPKEYHDLFQEKFRRAERCFNDNIGDNLFETITQEHAEAVALMAFGENENVRIKHDAPYYIEIWSRRNYTMLQIQDNGQMCLMKDGEYQPIPNCFGIVKFLVEQGYVLIPAAK